MTIDEARRALSRLVIPHVLYRRAGSDPEHGIITSVSERWVFVRFGADTYSKATDPADLELLAD